MNIKTLAFYLPQFHSVPENDAWWGEGFTEWTAVRAAKPLFSGHMQPKEPLNDKYYDLLKKETFKWQAQIAKQGGVSGFCFYHYWFRNGRKILEKPAEKLLEWTDIDIPFCFCWANQTWARTWSHLRNKNEWTRKYENNNNHNPGDSGILLEQKYGFEKDWIEHFEYLAPFFMDKRYIKIDGKPLFIFTHPQDVAGLALRIIEWRDIARQNGFPDLYLIGRCNEVNMANDLKSLDAILILEPDASVHSHVKRELLENRFTTDFGIREYDYDCLWETNLARSFNSPPKTFLSGVVNYDNTPRMGETASIIRNGTPEKFKDYFRRLVERTIEKGNEYVFINAWNEWGEGMYLEPDKENGFSYLKAINDVMTEYSQMNCEKEIIINENQITTAQIVSDTDKYKTLAVILDKWLALKEKGIKLEKCLADNNYFTIAIYGMGILGRHLVEELNDGLINVKYAIDKNNGNIKSLTPIYGIDDSWPKVDLIVITPLYELFEIVSLIKTKVDFSILSIEELIFENYH